MAYRVGRTARLGVAKSRMCNVDLGYHDDPLPPEPPPPDPPVANAYAEKDKQGHPEPYTPGAPRVQVHKESE